MSIFDPVTIGPLALRNGFVKSATYEGMTPGGVVSDALVEHHASMARQDVALTTVAYGAVEPSGRTFGDQLLVTKEAGLERIASAVRAEGGAVSLQLAHCGGFTKLSGAAGPSAGWTTYGLAYGVPRIRAMTEADFAKTTVAYMQTPRSLREMQALMRSSYIAAMAIQRSAQWPLPFLRKNGKMA